MDRTGRNCVNLEQRLLKACKEAVREGHWQVAEHLLRALEDRAKLVDDGPRARTTPNGVADAKIDFEKRTATVTFDADKATPPHWSRRRRTQASPPPRAIEMSAVVFESVLTCPQCGHAQAETMPADACQFASRFPVLWSGPLSLHDAIRTRG